VLIGVGLLTASAPAAAGEAPNAEVTNDDDLMEMSLDQLTALVVDKVYGASKHEQKLSEAPAAVSIVTSEDIKKAGHQSLAEILRSVRGFYVTYDRGYHFTGVRGINRPGDYGGRILINIDGQRVNDPIYGSAFTGEDFPLDVDWIDRIEIIRGPGSSLYGDNAFFAIINVITRRAPELAGAEFSAGGLHSSSGRVSYGTRTPREVAFAVSGTYFASPGQDRLYYPEFAEINGGVAEECDGGRGGTFSGSLDHRAFSLEGTFVSRTKDLPTGAYGTVFNDQRTSVKDQRGLIQLRLAPKPTDRWEMKGRVYYDHYHYHGRYANEDDTTGVGSTRVLNHDVANGRSLGTEFQVANTVSTRNRVTAGAEFKRDLVLELRNYDEPDPEVYLDLKRHAEAVGLYLQDELTIRSNLLLNAGLRYDHFSTFGSTWNPRGALIYSPVKQTVIKAIYGEAYRTPNVYEFYYAVDDYKTNPDLHAETVRAYELVCEQGLGRNVHLSSSVFYNDATDLIVFAADSTDGAYSFDNDASVKSSGFEVELDAHWSAGWHARTSYTYADAKQAGTQARLINSPAHLAKLELTVPVVENKLFGTVHVQGMSDRSTVQGNTAHGFVIAHFTMFGRELVRNLEISASVQNVFDRTYSDPVSDDFVQDTIEQDGRTFRFKLTHRL
jgi:iron complex outermembrane receptor protein